MNDNDESYGKFLPFVELEKRNPQTGKNQILSRLNNRFHQVKSRSIIKFLTES